MSQPLSIENKDWIVFITTRTAQSRLWFINNKKLESEILGCLARYQTIYEVEIFGFVLMGNHYHLIARFPKENRASFMRDFNAAVARIVSRHYFVKGRRAVWARRYAYQILPREIDLEHWYLYLVLNPVSSGIVDNIEKYPAYNSHHDFVHGRTRSYYWTNWTLYCLAKRTNPSINPEDFRVEYKLKISCLPKHRSNPLGNIRDYFKKKIKERTLEIQKNRRAVGKGFLGSYLMIKQVVGNCPRFTKQSSRFTKRPIVLSLCLKTRRDFLKIYYEIKSKFKRAVIQYLKGGLISDFPSGTYMPHRFVENLT